jgi:competence protein ComEC
MRLRIAVNRLREAVAARIRGAAGGDNGEIAVALVTGDRSGISQAAQESLRRSGLAHILSISGVHMALLSLTVIGAIRWISAWFPALVLRHPVRKWAAAAALIAVTIYLMLSGGEVATRRSWLMLAVMLAALLLDRRAISMRNVALAALVIVATTPEAVLEPGFQMSFAATAALVAAFSAWARWREERFDEPAIPRTNPVARAAAWTLRHAGGLAATSLVAGTGSGLIALWHFHRLALWGFVGNLLAMPVVSVAVMPLALLSCLAMPYGLEAPFVRAYAASVGVVMAISDFVAGFGAPAPVGASPKSALLLMASGLAILTLLATRLRLAGLAPLAIGLAISGSETAPDIVVAGDGRTVAVADSAGKLAPLSPRRNRFVAGIWLDAWSQGLAGNRTESFAACDADRCVLRPRGRDNPVAELVYDPKRLAAACGRADILIAPRLWFVDCRGRKPQIVLKRSDFERGGTIAIRIGERDGKPFAEAIASRGQPSRPWERMFAAAAEPPDFIASRGPPGRRSGRSPPR